MEPFPVPVENVVDLFPASVEEVPDWVVCNVATVRLSGAGLLPDCPRRFVSCSAIAGMAFGAAAVVRGFRICGIRIGP